MYYYKVWVASQRFHGNEPLTYGHAEKLVNGQIVLIPMRAKKETGIIVGNTTKPAFTVKPIEKVLVATQLPETSLSLLAWMANYYPAPSGVLASLLLPASFLAKKENSAKTHETAKRPIVVRLPPLTKEQKNAVHIIEQSQPETVLLHGATGSGKTRVYLEIANQTLRNGKTVLVLTPEIGLTSPLVTNIQAALSHRVIVIHSNLTEKQRRDAWLNILQASEPLIVVGPRSALFAPFTNIGLIIIDEVHDSAYKQDQAPYYHASRVASYLAKIHRAQLILGTATPSVNEYYIAKAKGIPIVRMKQPAITSSHSSAQIDLVNIRARENFNRTAFVSDILLKRIEDALGRHEQSLVFLNRRGTARLVVCQSCGWQALCKNCDLPLTYHGDSHRMRCHTCGFQETAASSCPVCKSSDVVYKSIGTKALAETLQSIFPDAVVRRFDTDNHKKDRFEAHYEEVSNGKVDIIVGTQMLIKGHDLPKLSVVGVIAADSSLSFPDFTADEQTFQLITQVIGRVGRGHREGSAVIQTIDPANQTILSAVAGDWNAFYERQLAERKQFGFPPAVQLLKLSCARASQTTAQTAATKLLGDLRKRGLPVQYLGPSPRFIEKTQGKYRWQIIVKSKSRAPLLEIVNTLPANWSYDIDPLNLL